MAFAQPNLRVTFHIVYLQQSPISNRLRSTSSISNKLRSAHVIYITIHISRIQNLCDPYLIISGNVEHSQDFLHLRNNHWLDVCAQQSSNHPMNVHVFPGGTSRQYFLKAEHFMPLSTFEDVLA